MRFTLVSTDGAVVLSVEDDGPGIPEASRAKALERFVRLDPARSRGTGGSGLGLSIAADVARAHRGALDLGTSDLGGLRVEVRLRGERVLLSVSGE